MKSSALTNCIKCTQDSITRIRRFETMRFNNLLVYIKFKLLLNSWTIIILYLSGKKIRNYFIEGWKGRGRLYKMKVLGGWEYWCFNLNIVSCHIVQVRKMAKLLVLSTMLVILCALQKMDSTPINNIREIDYEIYPMTSRRNNTPSDSIPKRDSFQEYVDKNYQRYKAILEKYRIQNVK